MRVGFEGVTDRIALQPETRAEQGALGRLLDRTEGAFYTLDIAEYPGLDEERARWGGFDPSQGVVDPGVRALILRTLPPWHTFVERRQ